MSKRVTVITGASGVLGRAIADAALARGDAVAAIDFAYPCGKQRIGVWNLAEHFQRQRRRCERGALEGFVQFRVQALQHGGFRACGELCVVVLASL